MSVLKYICLIPIVFLFNNCDSNHLRNPEQTVDVASIFPFNEKGQYFQNVQIVEKSEDSGVWNYQFIASIADADQESTELDVEFDVVDGEGNRVCPRSVTTVNNSNNHIQIASCESTTNYSALKVVVRAAPKGQALQEIATHDFDLSNL